MFSIKLITNVVKEKNVALHHNEFIKETFKSLDILPCAVVVHV